VTTRHPPLASKGPSQLIGIARGSLARDHANSRERGVPASARRSSRTSPGPPWCRCRRCAPRRARCSSSGKPGPCTWRGSRRSSWTHPPANDAVSRWIPCLDNNRRLARRTSQSLSFLEPPAAGAAAVAFPSSICHMEAVHERCARTEERLSALRASLSELVRLQPTDRGVRGSRKGLSLGRNPDPLEALRFGRLGTA
jgi:hypothetical protein